MNKPFVILGLTYAVGLFTASFFSWVFSVVLFLILVILASGLLLLFLKFKQNKKLILTIMTLALSFGVFGTYTSLVYNKVDQLDGKSATIIAQVTAKNKSSSGDYYYEIKTSSIDIENSQQEINLIFYPNQNLDLDYFDIITASVTFVNYNKGKSIINDYNRTNGFYISAIQNTDDVIESYVPDKKPFYYKILKLKDRMIDTISSYFYNDPKTLSILKAILFGDKSEISSDIYRDFKNSGIIHILVVSGLHLSILSDLLYLLLKRLIRNKIIVCFILLLFILFFVSFSGFTVSIVRAGLMRSIFYISKSIGTKSDSYISLSLSCLIMLLLNPYLVVNLGFLLTFCSTLAIIIYSHKIKPLIYCKIKNKLLFRLTSYLCCCMTINLFLLPFCVLVFKNISIISPVTNILVMPFVYFSLISGFVISIFGGLGLSSFISLLCLLVSYMIKIICTISSFLSSFSFSNIPLGFDFMIIFLFFGLAMFVISFMARNKVKMILVSGCLSSFVFLVGTLSYFIFMDEVIEVSFISEGYGKSIVVTYNKSAIIIGCGGSSYIATSVMNYLDSKGIYNIDMIFLPRITKSVTSGVPDLISNYDVKALFLSNEANISVDTEEISSNSLLINMSNSKISVMKDFNIIIDCDDKYPTVFLEVRGILISLGWNTNSLINSQYNQYSNISFILDNNYNKIDNVGGNIIFLPNTSLNETIITQKTVVQSNRTDIVGINISKNGNIKLRSGR